MFTQFTKDMEDTFKSNIKIVSADVKGSYQLQRKVARKIW